MASATMWVNYKPTQQPEAGDWAFYGRDFAHVTHVMMALRGYTNRAWPIPVIGASGGARRLASETPEEYWARMDRAGAMVKVYRRHDYRKDFLGFRKAPL